jgi:phosphate transport system permease protein
LNPLLADPQTAPATGNRQWNRGFTLHRLELQMTATPTQRPRGDTIEMPRRQKGGDRLFSALLTAAALVAPALLLVFIAVLADAAWPAIKAFGISFLTTSTWEPNPKRERYGALAFLVGTLVSSLLALALAAPIGIAAATFINEILPARLRGVSRFAIEILATIPSVVYGLWGVFILAPWVMRVLAPVLSKALGRLPLFGPPKDPRNMLCAVLVLAIMILPMIVAVAIDAMAAIPASHREAALGLGATRWEMLRIAVWPSARSGLIGGCILALGRALGETMAVTMVIGNGHRINASLFAASDTIASTIANQFAEAPSKLFTAALIELALLLFVVTLGVNVFARLIVRPSAARMGCQ